MVNTESFLKLLEKALSEINDERIASEKELSNISEEYPNEFVLKNMEIIKNDTIHTSVRSLSVLLLQNMMSIDVKKKNVYLRISEDLLKNFQREIVLYLTIIDIKNLRDKIADFIAKLGGSIINNSLQHQLTEIQKWPSLLPNIFELYYTKNINNVSCSLRILEGIVEKSPEKLAFIKQDLINLFNDCFTSSNDEIKVEGIKCLLTCVLKFKTKDSKDFKIFGRYILETLNKNLSEKKEELSWAVLPSVFDVCQNYPGFFKSIFVDLIHTMEIVREFKKEDSDNLKVQSVESLIFITERYEDVLKSEETKKKVVEIIFKNMIEIEDVVSEEWKNPPNGFNEDLEEDDDQSVIKIGMEFIDRLIKAVGYQIMIPFLSKYIFEMLNNQNWKMKNAALLTMSQICEYIEENNEIEEIINITQKNISSSNPRLRYACCQVLGHLASERAPDFQDDFHEVFFSIILPLLEDPVPRVVSHCFSTLTYFLENATDEQVEPHFEYIYTKIRYWLDQGISIVKEESLGTLSALAESSKDLFEPLYNEIINLLINIISQVKSPEYKIVKGTAIECITLIASQFGKEMFTPFIQKLIEILINIQTNEIDYDYDPQKTYIFSGWQRLSLLMEKDLLPYIEKILPSLITISSTPLINKNNIEIEDIDLSLQLIELFLKSYPEKLSYFIEDLYELLNLLLKEEDINEENKLSAVNCLCSLINIAKLNPKCNFHNIAKIILETVWVIFTTEKDASYRSSYCLNIQQCIVDSQEIMNEEEIFILIKKCELELQKIENRRKDILDTIDFDEDQPDVANFNVKIENTLEDECKLEIANIFGKIFQTYKSKSLNIFNYLYNNHILPSLENSAQLINISYGLFLIDDSIDYLGEYIDKSILENYYKIFMTFIIHLSTDIRQPAMYGLGILSKYLDYSPVLKNTLDKLKEGIDIDNSKNTIPSNIQKCKENGVSCLGKILKIRWNELNKNDLHYYLNEWFKYLPLTEDEKEAIHMHEMLVEILLNDSMLILKLNNQNIFKVVDIFKKIYLKKNISNSKIDNDIKVIMKNLVKDNEIKNVLFQNLNKEKTKFVKSLL